MRRRASVDTSMLSRARRGCVVGIDVARFTLAQIRTCVKRRRTPMSGQESEAKPGIKNSAGAVRRDDARDPDLSKIGIDPNLGKDGAERVHRVLLLFRTRFGGTARLDIVSPVRRDDRAAIVDVRRPASERADLFTKRE